MYIWVGIDVDSQLRGIGRLAEKARKEVGCVPQGVALPLHVSLKISFEAPDASVGKVIADIKEIYRGTGAFPMSVAGIEYCGVITWVAIKRSRELDALHDRLNRVLEEKYGVPLHEYDRDYRYHSTLYMDDDAEKVRKVYERIRGASLPETVMAKDFLIGTSESGKPGTYRVCAF